MATEALLISAYDAGSHAQWAQGLMSACNLYRWRRITLPARHFSWRVRGSGVSLLDPRVAEWSGPPPARLVVTSMLDLATAVALIPALRNVPSLAYFHENQFAYPGQTEGLHDIQLISIKTALAASAVRFNSEYNRRTFLSGVDTLLARMPDAVPIDLGTRLAHKSAVLPVPLSADVLNMPRTPRRPHKPLRIVWNHRWEYDKAPERLLAALRILKAREIAFELHVCGQQFRRRPPCFAAMETEFVTEIKTFAYLPERAEYLRLLARMDVVVSTALHDFQGLSVLEATAAGCIPVVPDRLAYVDFIDARWRYASWPDDPERESLALADQLTRYAQCCQHAALPVPPTLDGLGWSSLAAQYQACLAELETP